MNYSAYLTRALTLIKRELEINNDFVIGDEQLFMANKEPNKIYIVLKFLSVNYTLNAKLQPIQINVLTEQDTLENAKLLFDTFTERYNFKAEVEGTTYIKQQYSSPAVISNFQEVGYGFRSLLYVNANLFIMENVVDIKDLTINGIEVKPLNFSLAYSMSGNTQQIPSDYISSTIKSASTFSITLGLPFIDYKKDAQSLTHVVNSSDLENNEIIIAQSNVLPYTITGASIGSTKLTVSMQNNTYYIALPEGTALGTSVSLARTYSMTDEIIAITNNTLNGNNDFVFNFTLNGIRFNYTMKLISMQVTTSPDQIPLFNIGFMR